ncbi:TIR domain-containing protein [Phenylobacterium sp.]|uniref:TIR domain-containing protein n=1 Tax=Phenylobacterium sp. TaxID=1871053 RepID=UPI002F9257D8
MADVFISYSHDDKAMARLFADALEAEGCSVWWDAALRMGDPFDDVIEQALERAKAVVVLWSPRSVSSRWVRSEATVAERKGALLPAVIEPCKRPIMFELAHTADLCGWSGDATDPRWRSFVADLRRRIEQAPGSSSSSGKPTMTPSTRRKGGKPSLAVLPFVNLSGDREQEYLADGIAEDLTTALSRFQHLMIVGRNSSFAYKGQKVEPARVARELGVRYLLEGSVRKGGDRVRISAQLIAADTQANVWAERIDGAASDLFELQDEVTRKVVAAITPSIDRAELTRAAERPTEDLDAYDLYLQARVTSKLVETPHARRTVDLSKRALELDPSFGAAAAMIVRALVGRLAYGRAQGSAAERQELREYIERALTDARDDPEALCGCAHALAYVFADTSRAVGLIDRALALNENLAETWFYGGFVSLIHADFAVSRERFQHFIRLSPLDPLLGPAQGGVSWSYFFEENYQEGLQWARRAMQNTKDLQSRGGFVVNAALAGATDEAQRMLQHMEAVAGPLSAERIRQIFPVHSAEGAARLMNGFRMAGVRD